VKQNQGEEITSFISGLLIRFDSGETKLNKRSVDLILCKMNSIWIWMNFG